MKIRKNITRLLLCSVALLSSCNIENKMLQPVLFMSSQIDSGNSMQYYRAKMKYVDDTLFYKLDTYDVFDEYVRNVENCTYENVQIRSNEMYVRNDIKVVKYDTTVKDGYNYIYHSFYLGKDIAFRISKYRDY